eukprot:scaffold3290_cov165-Ochromonas_danica.AAC.37
MESDQLEVAVAAKMRPSSNTSLRLRPTGTHHKTRRQTRNREEHSAESARVRCALDSPTPKNTRFPEIGSGSGHNR